MYQNTQHSATAHPAGQGARITADGTPALGPVLLDADWIARTQGWRDDAERQRAYLRIIATAARITTNRETMSDDVQDADDLVQSLTDWHHGGALPLPSTLTTGVATSLIRRAARAVWANVQAARHADARWDAALADDGHAVAA